MKTTIKTTVGPEPKPKPVVSGGSETPVCPEGPKPDDLGEKCTEWCTCRYVFGCDCLPPCVCKNIPAKYCKTGFCTPTGCVPNPSMFPSLGTLIGSCIRLHLEPYV